MDRIAPIYCVSHAIALHWNNTQLVYISICYSENNQTSRIIHKATQNYVFYLLQIEKDIFVLLQYIIELNRIESNTRSIGVNVRLMLFHLLFLFQYRLVVG